MTDVPSWNSIGALGTGNATACPVSPSVSRLKGLHIRVAGREDLIDEPSSGHHGHSNKRRQSIRKPHPYPNSPCVRDGAFEFAGHFPRKVRPLQPVGADRIQFASGRIEKIQATVGR